MLAMSKGARAQPLSKLERATVDFTEAQCLWQHGLSASSVRRKAAMKRYEAAARSGVPEYQTALGQILCDSRYPSIANFRAGYRWILRAAKQGDVQAQYWIARELATGENVKRNAKLAAHWYRKAAMRGLASAQYNLGMMYLEGDGVPRNRAIARRWIVKAADNGEVLAKMLLADAYVSGEAGFRKNTVKADYWRNRS